MQLKLSFSDLSVRVQLAEPNDVIFVEQGKTFDISIECLDEEGNVAKFGQ